MRQAGADVVFTAESEVALALVESVLRHYGAEDERVEQARERLRDDLLKEIPAEA